MMSTKRKKMKLWSETQSCYVCGEIIEAFHLATLEHIIPRSKGGTNQQSNLALSHKYCNEIKSNHTQEEVWRREIRDLQKRREILIWRKCRSEYEIGNLLIRAFADMTWTQNLINNSFRFSEPTHIFEEDLQLQLNEIEKLRNYSQNDLIEASKKIDAYKTQPFWRLIFSIVFIDHYKRHGDVVFLLHAIWRLNQFKVWIKTPILFLIWWDLLALCRSLDQLAYERMISR